MGKPIVAPLVGAWIEIAEIRKSRILDKVAPLVGAWIEISCMQNGFLCWS